MVNGDATEVLIVRSRPVRNPIFLGLGTAAILAAGVSTTTAFAQPTPSPSGSEAQPPPPDPSTSPTPTPTGQAPEPPVLHVNATATTATTVLAGRSVKARVLVDAIPDATNTVLKLTTSRRTKITPTCANPVSGGCALGTEDRTATEVPVTIQIPSGAAAGTITFTATATADGATAVEDKIGIRVTRPSSGDSGGGNVSDNSNGGGGGGGSNNSDSGGSGGTGGSGGSGGSGGGTVPGTTTTTGGGLPFAPPGTAGSLQQTNPGATAQFPQIAPPAADPATAAAAGQRQNMGALRAAAPEPQELTFQRLASTQAAWLAALLVAFSLLLTQIRLGKPPEARRRKGVHRRTRTGAFQA
jgi:hypothetical protein